MALDPYGVPIGTPTGPAVANGDFNPAVAQYMPNASQWEQAALADPKYLVWKRAQGASDAVARAEAAQAITSARTAQGNLPGEYADMLGQSLRKISDQFENNGMFQSSNRLRAQNEQQGRLEGQMLGQRNQYADTINSAGISLSKQLAQGQMDSANQMGDAAARTYGSMAETGLNPFQRAVQKTPGLAGIR